MATATQTKLHSRVADDYLQALSGLDTDSKIEVIQYLLATIHPAYVKGNPVSQNSNVKPSFAKKWAGVFTLAEDANDVRYNALLEKYAIK
ncbi:hypothetical protein AGMMS49965_04480 [Bacteroidia bacterium]|nr:hypothetical protein AGMMS49965_04480 [Bacteroidia bacterium]